MRVQKSISKDIDEKIEEWDWDKAVPTGKAVPRKIAHKLGIAHEGVHLWVIRTVNGFPELLFQHRAKHKGSYPDYLDISVGGHVPFGREKDKVQKEAFEEIGISPLNEDMIDLGFFRYEEQERDYFHREFQRVYLIVDNRPLDDYIFIDGEVEGIYAIPLKDLEMLLVKDFSLNIEGYDGTGIINKKISRKDIHPLLFSSTMKEYMRVIIEAVKELSSNRFVTAKMPSPV